MADAPPRSFIGPFIGIALLFAALGPPIGGATFVPLALVLKASAAAGAFAFATVIAALFGHWIMLFAAYAIGLGPAVATGVLYALWDAAAPPRWPRALAAAVIGGFVAYMVALRVASLDMMFEPGFDAPAIQSISLTARAISVTAPDPTAPVAIETGLVRAFVMSGAFAAFICAMAASLTGLTMQPTPFRPDAEGAA
jgi:hypothetical protein